MDRSTILRGSPIVTATDAALVAIDIERNAAGVPRQLHVRTGTHRDPVIFWTPDGKVVNRDLAREVLWTTVDLHAGERLDIQAKPHQHPHFEYEAFELDARHFTVDSGPVRSIDTRLVSVTLDAGDLDLAAVTSGVLEDRRCVVRGRWRYDVVLHSARLERPMVLDPVIIIVEDP